MKAHVIKTLILTGLALGSCVFAANSQAALVNLNGTSSIGATGATITGVDLSAPGVITVVNPKYGLNNGDFSPIPQDTLFTLAGPLDITNMSSFNITGPANIGTYVASQLIIITQRTNFLDVYTRGIIKPGITLGTQGGGCATPTGINFCTESDAALRWSFTRSFTQTQESISASGTFASPGFTVDIPEPTSLALFGIGLFAMAANRRRLSAKPAAAN